MTTDTTILHEPKLDRQRQILTADSIAHELVIEAFSVCNELSWGLGINVFNWFKEYTFCVTRRPIDKTSQANLHIGGASVVCSGITINLSA